VKHTIQSAVRNPRTYRKTRNPNQE